MEFASVESAVEVFVGEVSFFHSSDSDADKQLSASFRRRHFAEGGHFWVLGQNSNPGIPRGAEI
jgi:hypothetical protein